MHIATSEQQRAVEQLGRRLVAELRAFVESDGTLKPGADDETLNYAIGRMVILSLFSAANSADWLNKVWLSDGVAHAIGEAVAQFADQADQVAFYQRLNATLARGHRKTAAALAPRGQA